MSNFVPQDQYNPLDKWVGIVYIIAAVILIVAVAVLEWAGIIPLKLF